MKSERAVAIVGGGLAGLISAVRLARMGISCTVFEKQTYPFHRVCGEYVSNEVIPFLRSIDCFPAHLSPPSLTEFHLTSVNGALARLPLDLGGFGVSRYAFDAFLAEQARHAGAVVFENCEVTAINWQQDRFTVHTATTALAFDVVIGSFGKRSKLDVALQRAFVRKRYPYVGVKYHLRTDHPADVIALHNFKDGYCGISQVENGITNLCYLTHRDNLRTHGTVERMEREVLFENPFLKKILSDAEFVWPRPEVISEISFQAKEPVEQHILMAGDSAGMITPLCGNGMAIAIHTAKLASDAALAFCRAQTTREEMERQYARAWRQQFATRLWAGRQIQRLFGSRQASNLAVGLARHQKTVAGWLMRQTHGQPFV